MVDVGTSGGRRCVVVESVGFTAGGYQWAILFYPYGDADAPGSSGYVSVSLALVTCPARVRASFNLGLVNRATGLPAFQPEDTTAVFDNAACCCSRTYPYPIPTPASTCRHERIKRSRHGVPRLMRRCELEASPAYLRDDAVTVACVVTGVTGTALVTSRAAPEEEIRVPGRNLHLHIGELLASREGADVTFDVDGEAFAAHRIILAARSPVFDAELYGSGSATETDDGAHAVTVRDMRPATFRALLHFVYTDSLPAMSHLGMDERRELVQHLLAAADRYAIDRLKVMCEHILARTLHVENAATTLALADRHGCDRLKHASIHFMTSSSDSQSKTRDDVAIEALEKTM